MAETKNVFLGAKMNKDLDPRLISNREYIEARNASVTDSAGGDSGVLENVFGNSELTTFGLTDSHLKIIGFYVDTTNDRLFAFLTNYTDSSATALDNYAPSGSAHYIAMYNTINGEYTILVGGSFLNFSDTHEVLGIDLIENLLFFTDNRNQPRKINVNLAIANPYGSVNSYYTAEEHISIAKYYPYQAPSLSKLKGDGSIANGTIIPIDSPVIITGVALPTGVAFTVGVTSGVTTDGSGGTLTCNVETFASGTTNTLYVGSMSVNVAPTDANNNYAVGDKITITEVALISFFGGSASGDATFTISRQDFARTPSMWDVVSENLPLTQVVTATAISVTQFTASATVDANWVGSLLTTTDSSGVDIITVEDGIYITAAVTTTITHTDTTASGKSISNTDIVTIGANPYYDANFDGDVDFLSDKFVKFSYRFKFEDGEHSLIAPFSQAAFIPKQDGYFIDETFPTNVTTDGSDENNAIRSTIIAFFENKVNCMDLIIDMPEDVDNVEDLYNELRIEAIEIIYKQSDQTSLKVVDIIEKDDLVGITGTQYSFTYKSDSPIKTLPQDEITRAADKAPIKAQAQEVTGNRVIYGNYVARSARPKTLNYQLLLGDKNDIGVNNSLNKIEYPAHTLKQNRSYKVGIVLCDKFGRQSDVIVSNNCTINNEYRGDIPLYDSSDIYGGDSLKIVFNSEIPSTINKPGYVGLYGINDTNPTGWYSYKVVVQQKEQDYYNLYLPTVLNNYPKIGSEVLSENVAFVTLFSDNVNKAPRDLKEVGPQDIMYSSSVEMYPRVDNDVFSLTLAKNKQFFPDKLPDKLVRIGLRDDIGLDKDVDGSAYTDSPFYGVPDISQKGSNPFIGEMSTRKQIGNSGGDLATATNQVTYKQTRLNVYETIPFESQLDIYYETGTSGLISELNTFIANSASQYAAVDVGDFTFNGNENDTPVSNLSTTFFPVNSAGVDISGTNMTGQIISVVNVNGTDVTSKFDLYRDGTTFDYNIRSAAGQYFVFETSSINRNNYKFTIRFTDITSGTIVNDVILDFPNQLSNAVPTFTGSSPFAPGGTFLENTTDSSATNIKVLDGQNGTASTDPDFYKRQLLWTVELVEFYWTATGAWTTYPDWEQYFRAFKDTAAQTYDQVAETLQYYNQLTCLNVNAANDDDWYDFNNRRDTDFRVHLRLYDANGIGLSTTARVDFTLTRNNA